MCFFLYVIGALLNHTAIHCFNTFCQITPSFIWKWSSIF